MFRSNRSYIIILTVISFSVISFFGISMLFNKKENIDYGKTVEANSSIDGQNFKLDLNGTYNENSIDIKEQELDKNDEEIDIEYIEICGLKKHEDEEKINNELLEEAKNYSEYIDTSKDEINSLKVSEEVSCNFSNVLSVKINYIGYKSKEELPVSNIVRYLNFDLTSGNKIEFKDLFNGSSNIEEILSYSVYNSSLESMGKNNEKLSYSDIEEIKKRVIKNYSEKKKINFGISNSYIIVDICGDTFKINMEEFQNDIAIYSRFVTNESIYLDDSIGLKNIENLVTRNRALYNKFGKISEKKYVDIYINSNIKEDGYETIIKNIVNKEKEIVENKKQDTNDEYINLYNSSIKISLGFYNFIIEEEKLYINENIKKEYFDTTFYPKIRQWLRKREDESSVYNIEDENVVCKKNKEYKYYNSKTGKIIEKVSDIFKTDVDYISQITSIIGSEWTKKTGEEINKEEIDNIKLSFDIKSNNIIIKSDKFKDKNDKITLELDKLDKASLIFY